MVSLGSSSRNEKREFRDGWPSPTHVYLARVPRCNLTLTIYPTLRARSCVLARPVESHFGLPRIAPLHLFISSGLSRTVVMVKDVLTKVVHRYVWCMWECTW
jgi:hypothetical protein